MGSGNHGLSNTLDIFTTCLALADVALPHDRIIDGVNLTPLLKQKKDSVRDVFFFYRGEQLYAVRMGPWKAHFKTIEEPYGSPVFQEHDPPLLFNVEIDPSEKYNVEKENSKILKQIVNVRHDYLKHLKQRPSQLEKRLPVL